MMGGNPTDWWSMMMMMDASAMHSQSSSSSSSSQHVYGSSSNSLADNSSQDFPRSWSQVLLGGMGGENERFGGMMMNNPSSSSLRPPFVADVKQEFPQINNIGLRHLASTSAWSHHHQADMAVSSSSASPNCSVSASLSTHHNNNVFNFPSSTTKVGEYCKNQHDSSECNSTSSGGPSKKPRVHHSSSQPSLKLQVRKEKLGDRITALHQIVSPFGKTDTASVLSEAIGYIRFLHSQIQALSTPYIGNNPSGSMARHSHQLSNPWLTGGGNKDLRSKGLCLVPVSCIQHVGSDDVGAAGYWAPAHGGGF